MRNMDISKELKLDVETNQTLLKTAIYNHQVSFGVHISYYCYSFMLDGF